MRFSNLLLFCVLMTALYACKSDNTKKTTTTTPAKKKVVLVEEDMKSTSGCTYSYDPNNTKIAWIAYKTTDRLPVGGKFEKFKVKPGKASSKDPKDLLRSLEFNIDVGSTNTNNPDRDAKIVKHFFHNFDLSLEGKVTDIKDNKVIVALSMNDKTHDVELDYVFTDNFDIILKGNIDVAKWSGMKAINALNKICYDLHKGPDGKSKLWSEVGIDVVASLKSDCK